MPEVVTENTAEQKITYATMSGDRMASLHRAIDEAVRSLPRDFGREYPMIVGGEAVVGRETFEDRSPIDTRTVLGRFQKGTREDVERAVGAAKQAFPAWSRMPLRERLRRVRALGALLRRHRVELSVLMGFETGKNRLECLGDVEESADFMDYYCDQLEEQGGFERRMDVLGPGEENWSVLRPYGVFAVVSPFNFPMALAAGPSSAALATGNTVILKPASDTPLLGVRLGELALEADLPPGTFNVLTGGGGAVGQPLVDHADVAGIVFTGSVEVGMRMIAESARRPVPRPVIAEMGGKNPALVMASADVEKAARGVFRSAFGAQGQKCSACSRVYVAEEIHETFVEALVAETEKVRIGDPLERDVWLGPVINQAAVDTFLSAVELARSSGGRILTGGHRITRGELAHGYFVEPTVVDGLPHDHALFREELFVPFVTVAKVSSFEEAMAHANRTEYGLTAGIFSQDDGEIAAFFDGIEAGVVYANREAGATTGAWPGINPFGGWKSSGSTGRGAGGPHYVQQFLREQSRVRIL